MIRNYNLDEQWSYQSANVRSSVGYAHQHTRMVRGYVNVVYVEPAVYGCVCAYRSDQQKHCQVFLLQRHETKCYQSCGWYE